MKRSEGQDALTSDLVNSKLQGSVQDFLQRCIRHQSHDALIPPGRLSPVARLCPPLAGTDPHCLHSVLGTPGQQHIPAEHTGME
ncbi:unnamed protein product [Merluccius merluccius]